MSLTATDLGQIRTIVRDEVHTIVRKEVRTIVREEVRDEVSKLLQPLKDEIAALRNDVANIYNRLVKLESAKFSNKEFDKLPVEKRVLALNTDLLVIASEMGIKLPQESA